MFLKNPLFLRCLVLGMTLLVAGAAQADRRQYLATYGYYTPIKGELEIEQWTDAFAKKGGGTDLRSRTEIEYGVTDRLAMSLYLVAEREAESGWDYTKTKLETRYRITESGHRFWDTAGYLEIARPSDSSEPWEMEAKAIFSHEFPKFNLTLNLIGEKEMEPGAEIAKGYAIGLAPQRKGRIGYSIEMFGEEHEHYLMPGIWWGRRNSNIGLGVAAGLTGDSDRLQVRTLYAMEF